MPRFVASAPSYILGLLVLSVVGATASLYLVRLYLPMSVQEHYLGRAVVYTYSINSAEGTVYVRLFNPKSYRAKVDVLLLKDSGAVLTSCRGYVAGSRVVNGSVSLMGIVVEPSEEVTVACFERGVRDVRVFDYGLDSPKIERAREGVLPGLPTPVDHPIDIGLPWIPVGFRYRMPITVVTTTHRDRLCVAVTISPATVGQSIFDFVNTITKAKGEDILVASATGYIHPTHVTKSSNSITVYFTAEDVPPGIHRFYLYFGNPDLAEPVRPMLNECVPQVSTPSSGLPRQYLSSEFSFPGYVVPEANWYQQDDELIHGHRQLTTAQELNSVLSSITSASYPALVSIISSARSNRVPYPVGTPSAYSGLNPKTQYGGGSWGTLTVVDVASFSRFTTVFDVSTQLYVASDEGVSAYLVALDHHRGNASVITYLTSLSNSHQPRYAGLQNSIVWSYETQRSLQRSVVDGREVFLVILHQNGVLSGGGPGWLDFRFVAVWVEMPSTPPIGALGWLHGWRYRKRLDISGSDWGHVRSYLLRVTVHYGSGTDSGHNMYCNGKCRPDFGDIRFTSGDGKTLLPYCLITKRDGMDAVFYVRTQRPGAGEVASIYVYYGNSNARYEGDCTKVFGREVASLHASDRFYDAVILSKREQHTGTGSATVICNVEDDGSCRFDLPFKVRVYDTAVSCLHLSSNGFARWNCQPDSRCDNFVDTQNKILAPHWDDLRNVAISYWLGTDPALGDYVSIAWVGFYAGCDLCAAIFQLVLYKNWALQFNIVTVSSSATPSSFVSAGDGSNYIDLTPRWQYRESVIFVPKFPSVYVGWGPEES